MLGATLFVDRDGHEWQLLFDHEAMILAEDVASMNGASLAFADVVDGATKGRLGCLRALVFGALRRHHPTVTRGDAAAMVTQEGAELGRKLFEALAAAMPKPDPENPPKAASGTGTRSSSPGAKRGSSRTASSAKHPARSPRR